MSDLQSFRPRNSPPTPSHTLPFPAQTTKTFQGDTLASCGADRTVRTWHQLRGSGGTGGGKSAGTDGGGGRWAPDAVLEESQARAVRSVAWAPPHETSAAAASQRGKGYRGLLRGHRRRRRRRLAAASFDASVAVWEEERPPPPPASGESRDGEVDNDGGDDDDEPTLWSQVALLQGHESEVKDVAWSPLPVAFEAGSSEEEGGEEGGMEEEEEEEEDDDVAERGDDEKPLPPSSSSSPPLLGDGEGCLLATCGRDRSVWLWESVPSSSASSAGVGIGGIGGASACEFECVDVKQGHAGDVKSVAWHPSGSVLASCSYDGTVRLWLPEGGASEEGIGGGGTGSGTATNAASFGDEWLCGQEVKDAHGGETVWSLAFEPRIWRRSKSKNRKHVRAASCGGDGRVSVWSCPLPWTSEGEPATEALSWQAGAVARSAVPPALGGRVRPAYSVDWSGCGEWIASGGGDDCVRVFRAPPEKAADAQGEEKKGREEVILELAAEARPSPHCEVNCVKWRPKRRKSEPPMLAAACDDGVVRLWRLEKEEKES